MNKWGLALQSNYVTFQDGSPQEIQGLKQISWYELYTENLFYQI